MNKQKIALLTDSCADIPAVLCKRYDIYVVPLKLIFSDGEYADGVDITPTEVYRRLPKEMPKTTLPSGAAVEQVLGRIRRAGYTRVLAIHLSGGLSGTCNLVRVVGAQTEGLEVAAFDSLSGSLGTGMMVLQAARWIEQGWSWAELLRAVPPLMQDTHVFFCVNTLEYLQKGGRIGKVAAMVGTAISLKPVISCNEEGRYYAVAKAIGRNPSIKKVLELAQKFADGCPKVMLAVMHGDAAEEAEALIHEVKKKIPQGFIAVRGQISPALGVHTGPGLVGICVLRLS